MEREAPWLLEALEAARPGPLPSGYQVLPRIVDDIPAPAGRPRATPYRFSWRRTEQRIDQEIARVEALEGDLARTTVPPPIDDLVARMGSLARADRFLHNGVQYHRLWQPEIARNPAAYDRLTALCHAALDRQALRDALQGQDEEIHAALHLRAREAALTREIRAAVERDRRPPFVTIERPRPDLVIVRVPVFTDVVDAAFVQAFKNAVERVWHVRDADAEFRVELTIATVAPAMLYAAGGPAPRPGARVDLGAHCARFPPGGVLTTGAGTTHVLGSRCIVLGPHDIAPRVLAHEFGHVLGFRDAYFRGYRDLGPEGYEIMEVSADPEDLMGAPGWGVVSRRHFEPLGLREAAGR